MRRSRMFAWIVGIWVFLQGVATIWPAFSERTIPAAVAASWPYMSGNLFGWLSLFVGLCVIAALVWERRSQRVSDARWINFSDWEVVRGKTFLREDVVVDGKFFDRCEFIDANLVFNGTAPVKIEEPVWRNSLSLKTPNQVAISAMQLLQLVQAVSEAKGVKATISRRDKFGKYSPLNVTAKKLP